MSSKQRNRKTFSIAVVIISVLIIFSLAGTIGILLMSKKYSVSAIHDLADGIITRTVNDSAQHVNSIIQPAQDIVYFLKSYMPENAVISEDSELNQNIVSSIIDVMENNTNVYTAYYANENGEFFLVGRRQKFEDSKRKFYFHKKISIKNDVRTAEEYWYQGHEQIEHNTLGSDKYDPRVRPWYLKAKDIGKEIWTSPYVFYITKLPGITYALPLYDEGKFIGVIGADLEINTISDFLVDATFTKNTQIFAIDSDNNILAHSGFSGKYENISSIKETIPKYTNFDDPVLKIMMNKVKKDGSYDKVNDIVVDDELFKGVVKPFTTNGLEIYLGMYTPASDYLMTLNSSYKNLFIIAVIVLAFVIFLSKAISRGLARPFQELSASTESAKLLDFDKGINIRTYFTEVEETQRNFNEMLESLRNYQSANEVLSSTLKNAHIDTLYRLAMAAEHKDFYTYDHLKRVSDISVMIAEIIGMSAHDTEQLRHASAMHDVGKLGIPDSILMKPGKLTKAEYSIIKSHSELGAKILEKPSSEVMSHAQIVARSHHERWDGSGYPYNLTGEKIPLFGRIVALADVTDALLSKRPYKEPFSFEKTIDIIKSERGFQFDPELTDVVLENQNRLYQLINTKRN